MTDQANMSGPGGIDAQVAVERLRELIAQLEAAKASGEGAKCDVAGGAPQAALPPLAGGLADWLRADLAARHFGASPTSYVEVTPITHPREPGAEPRPPDASPLTWEILGVAPVEPVVPIKDRYAIGELLDGHDAAFVRNGFRAILGREPEAGGGFEHFRSKLGRGEFSRLDVLCELRYSDEGRARHIRIDGLSRVRWARSLRRIPVLGTLLAIAHAVLRLPGIAMRLERAENRLMEIHWQFSVALHRLLNETESGRAQLRAYAIALHGSLSQLQASDAALRKWTAIFGENLTTMDVATRKLQSAMERQATREELGRALEQVVAALSPLAALPWEIERHKGTVALIEAGAKQALLRMSELERMHAQDVERLSSQLPSPLWSAASKPALDDFYAQFENRFRGTFEDIKSRLVVYVPLVEAAVGATGAAPIVDIGSGRGEWLELLRAGGFVGRGVDTSASMVKDSRARGLDVLQADGLDFLRGVPDGALAAVTAFHVIEHLPFPSVMELFRESLRALKPGGVVIFETPNPENLIVGAHTFWYDPTHLKPLPPEIMQFAAQAHGFERVEIRRLHPHEPWERLPDQPEPDLRVRLNALLYGPRDYSVIAYKPPSIPTA